MVHLEPAGGVGQADRIKRGVGEEPHQFMQQHQVDQPATLFAGQAELRCRVRAAHLIEGSQRQGTPRPQVGRPGVRRLDG
jgi:hypothetical protein